MCIKTYSAVKLSQFHLDRWIRSYKCAEYNTPPVKYPVPALSTRANPRWNPISGQNGTVVLRNATLFDGEKMLSGSFDIIFQEGIISSISLTALNSPLLQLQA